MRRCERKGARSHALGGGAAAWAVALVITGCVQENHTETCGAGTHLSGTTCVVGEPDAQAGGSMDSGIVLPSRDSGRDAKADGGKRDATSLDGNAPRDGRAADGGKDVSTLDGARDAAPDVSVPESCGDINACIPSSSDAASGPIELGVIDACAVFQQLALPVTASGSRSEWLRIQYVSSCMAPDLFLILESPPTGRFDLDIYEVRQPKNSGSEPPPTPSACPGLVESSSVTLDSGGAGIPAAFATAKTTGEIYIHVVSEPKTTCASGSRWSLAIETQ